MEKNPRFSYKLMERTNRFFKYFEDFAPRYVNYRKRFSYYWNDVVHYNNYYITNDQSVLEIGCGAGDTLSKLKGRRKVGIDYSPAMIEKAIERFPDLEFKVMSAEKIELNETFDVVVLPNVIGYFDNVLDVFESIRSVCHDDTKLIISYYNYVWEPALKIGEMLGLKKKSPTQNWLSHLDIYNLLYLSGFEEFRTTRRMLMPVYIPLISYVLNRFVAKLPFVNFFCLFNYVNARRVNRLADNEVSAKYSTTVLIPARNESGNIENAILRLPKFGKHIEIIFVEGNSTDDTWEKIQEMQKKYSGSHDIKILQQKGKGKGDAVRTGYDVASGDILMILDADLTVMPEDLPKFYNAIASGKGDFINGSRLVYPMEEKAMRFLNHIGNKFFSLVFSWLLEQPIKDTLCGTKVMFRKDYIKLKNNRSFFGNFDPFGDYDLLFGAYKLNLKIIDLPIRYQQRTYGDTNISRFKHGLLLLRMCLFASRKIKFW